MKVKILTYLGIIRCRYKGKIQHIQRGDVPCVSKHHVMDEV